jgi:hypothetical protein
MNESLLISQVEPIRSKAKPGEVIGVSSTSRWQGPGAVTIAQDTWRVVQCDSVLELRERLSEEGGPPLIVVTSLDTSEVGDDVRARLYKQRLLTVDPWTLLAVRFKARQIDPTLRLQRELADAVMEALGQAEPLPAASGVLTPEAAWQVVVRNRLGLDSARPDLQGFLEWLATDGTAMRWLSLDEPLRGHLRAWFALGLSEMGEVLLRSLEAGHGSEALALGLALGAFRVEPTDAQARVALGTAQGRLERYTGNQPLSTALIRRWNEASEQWAIRLCGAGKISEVRDELVRSDQILEAIGASDYAGTSRWSLLGFQQRLDDFAKALNRDDSDYLRQAFAKIKAHEAAPRLEELRGRRDRAEMAVRLSRWLDQSANDILNLDEAAAHYLREGSWVDWARHQLLSGDEPEAVSRSYRRLFDRVTARREQENRGFAGLLAAATAANQLGGGIIPIEHVLDRVVAPLARKVPAGVLAVVMDGMSLPVLRELSQDLARHGWLEWMPADGETWGIAMTALPSITSFSRASLICGALTAGAQNTEKHGFEEHGGLRAASKSAFPPILFHKDEIGASGGDLAEAVRIEIRNPNRRIVGVVVNVVDDSLEGPEQLAIRWTLDQVPILRALLSEARDAGRAAVLLSDHGHVLDQGSTFSRRQDASDRWRPASADQNPSGDELMVSGPRVLADGQHFIAPVTESLRYTPNRRQGYHGGLTPQECLAPISVIAPSVAEIEGWHVQAAAPPDWWFDGLEAVVVPESRPGPRKGRPKVRPALPLFEESAKTVDWVATLLASEVFVQQMEVFGGRLKKDQVEQALRVLIERNGVQMKPAFAQRLAVPPIRIDGFLASLQRILNVDGYPVLTSDASQTIRLNLLLLREQFELSEESNRGR